MKRPGVQATVPTGTKQAIVTNQQPCPNQRSHLKGVPRQHRNRHQAQPLSDNKEE